MDKTMTHQLAWESEGTLHELLGSASPSLPTLHSLILLLLSLGSRQGATSSSSRCKDAEALDFSQDHTGEGVGQMGWRGTPA